jgi:hypothetical protein
VAAALFLVAVSAANFASATDVSDHISINGEIRPRFEYEDNFNVNKVNRQVNEMVFMRTRVGVNVDVTDRVFARVQLQDVRRWGDPATNASSVGDTSDLTVREAFVELSNLWGDRLDLRLGRQALVYGDERLMGDLDWHRVGRTHDAALATFRPSTGQRWDAFAVFVTENDNAAGMPAARGGRDADAHLYGVYGKMELRPFTRFEPFWIMQDYDSVTLPALVPQVASSGSAGNDLRVHTVGLNLGGELMPRLFWDAEGHYQFGDYGTRNLRSYLLHGRLTWEAFLGPIHRIQAGYDLYSGDDIAGDGVVRTYQPVFPSYYRHTGISGWIGMKNLDLLTVSIGGTPAPDWTWRIDWRQFHLRSRQDQIYAVTNAVAAGVAGLSGSRLFADQFDLGVSYRWNAQVTWTAAASVFEPHGVMSQVITNGGGVPGTATHLLTQLEVKF